MPLFYQHDINHTTKLAIWHITEPESFFTGTVPLQRSITHPHKRLQHLAGRYLLKNMFTDFPFEEIVIADTRKPYLPYEQYHFSLSHCGDYAAAIASSSHRVGIDIEMPVDKIHRIRHKFLNSTEQELLAGNPMPGHTLQQLTVYWSAKEAVFKWWGWGNVDFSDHIQLHNVATGNTGIINGSFIRDNERVELDLFYRIFGPICLVWVVS